MSVIVASPREGVIVADRFVLENSNHPHVPTSRTFCEDKVQVSEDGCFAWVFESERHDAYVPVVLSYIERFERGLLTDEDKPLAFPKEHQFKLIVMSRKHFYRVNSTSKKPVVIRKDMWSNQFSNSVLLPALELNAEQVFSTLVIAGYVYATRDMTITKQSSLKAIKVTKRAHK